METHHSCLNTRAIIEYFEDRAPEAIPRLLKGLGPEIDALPDPLEFLKESNNWVSSDVVIRMFDNAQRITGNRHIAFDIGFQSASRKKLGYIQRVLLFAYKNPRRTLRRVQAINDKLNKNKIIQVVESGRDHAIVRLHWKPEIPASEDFCLFNKGIYAGLPTVWNLPPALVVETKCFFKGDDYCEYRFNWERRSFWRQFFRRMVLPWSTVKSAIGELEEDKELLRYKFKEVHKLNLQLKERIDQLLCLQQTGATALSLLHLEEILQVSLELLIKFTKLDRAIIFLLDERQQILKVRYAAGVEDDFLERFGHHQIPLFKKDDIIALVAVQGTSTVISEATHSELYRSDPVIHHLHPQAAILAPLMARNKIIGIILADRQQHGVPITDSDLDFVISFANQTAIALENAMLYQKIETSERQYRGLVENAHEGVWVLGEDGRVRFANRRMQEISGEQRLEGRQMQEFWDADHLPQVEKILEQNQKGRVVQKELEIIPRKGDPRAVIMSSVPIMENGRFTGTFAMFSDISEKKAMEKQLLQQQKMEAIGTLAGGIAHNFNNILMNIMGLCGLVRSGEGLSEQAAADLKLIEQEVVKGSALTRQMLSLGRGSTFSPQPLNLNRLLEETARLFSRTRSGADIVRDLAPELPAVEVDQSQLEQVMLNLFVNAWHAMGRQGKMTLSTQPVVLTEAFCQPYKRPPGSYVLLTLVDTGMGMDEQTVARIFEPFFTTKEVGQGTGLGLATVYAIIKNHRGIIQVESERGRGTTFRIYLPASPKAVAADAAKEQRFVRGGGTILLVDDEPNIRLVAKRMLERLGYTILLAADGPEALQIFHEESHRLDLVILDMIMPGMGGAEAFQKMKEADPRVRVLLSSGYSIDGQAQRIMDAGALGFIQKPYRIETLSHKVAEILGSAETGARRGAPPLAKAQEG